MTPLVIYRSKIGLNNISYYFHSTYTPNSRAGQMSVTEYSAVPLNPAFGSAVAQ